LKKERKRRILVQLLPLLPIPNKSAARPCARDSSGNPFGAAKRLQRIARFVPALRAGKNAPKFFTLHPPPFPFPPLEFRKQNFYYLEEYMTTISREDAWKLLRKYNTEAFHLEHALTVEGVMNGKTILAMRSCEAEVKNFRLSP
jgi:hypothetical protein